MTNKGVFAGPRGPFQEGPGVGHKTALDTKPMKTREEKIKKRKEKRRGKENMRGEKKNIHRKIRKELQKCS